ncbi:MAG: hypothetical protein ACRDKZ_06875 [Actinomycetota bacterium]
MKARVALGVVLTALALSPWIAHAHHVDPRDANDTRGTLDVRKIKSWGSASKPGLRIITFRRWTTEQVWDYGQAIVNLDTFGKKRPDYYVVVRSTGSAMKGTLWRDRKSKSDRRVTKVRVWRPNRRSVNMRFPLSKLRRGKSRLFYAWYVQTLFQSNSCPRVCFDRVPNRGRIKDPNGRPTPKPTPTPTPTPTETPP